MARLILFLVLVCQVLGTVLATTKEHYDLKVHYRPVQENLNNKQDANLAVIQSQLITKLSEVIQIEPIEIQIYDLTVVGEHLDRPTLIVHAELSLDDKIGRDEFVKRLSKQNVDSKEQLFIPYLRPIDKPSKNNPSLHKLLPILKSKINDQTKSTAVMSCVNGGVLLPNATCSCQNYFGGDDCSILCCEHEGLAIESTRCVCPPGWIGRHCEILPTLPPSQYSFDFSSRTLVLVLNNVISTTLDIQQSLFAINSYFSGASAERQNFYKNFVLLTFVHFQDNYIEIQLESNSYNDFIQQIAAVIPLEGDDTQPILSATKTAITQLTTTLPKSTVIVVIDHLASDSSSETNAETSDTIESSLLKNALYWQHSINIILTQRSDEQRADDPGDPYNSLKRLSQRANGELADLGKTKINVKQAVTSVLQAQFKAETLAVQRDVDFSQTLNFKLPTSKNSQLYVSGQNFQLKDSSDTVINPTQNGGNFALYSLSNSQTNLKLVPQSGASAKISYRAVVETDKQVFVAYTSNNLADATSSYSVSGIPHQAVLNAPSEFSSAKVSGVSGLDSTKEIFGQSDLQTRPTDSNFQFIAKSAVDCKEGPLLTKIQLGGDDLLIPAFCYDPDHHNGGSLSVNTCNHHGIWDPKQKKCICDKFFNGQNCENVECQNGGSVNEFPGNGSPICLCDAGFDGDHCESMSCFETAEVPDFSNKSLSVVVQRSYSQAFLNTEIRDSVKAALESIENEHGVYFSDLILTTFVKAMTGSDPEIQIQSFSNSSDLVQALNAANIKYSITMEEQQSSFQAILDTLKVTEVAEEQDRLILLFVDSPPKNPELIEQIKTIARRKSIKFHVLLTAPYGLDGSGECMNSDSVNLYKDLSHTTSGLFFDLCKTYTAGAVKNFLTGFIGASYKFQPTRKHTSSDCNAEIPVKVGDQTDLRYFLIDADQSTEFDVSLQTTDGQTVEINQTGKLDTAILFQANNLEQKEYKLKVSAKTATKCRITVGQPSDLHLSISFTENPSFDASNETIMFGHTYHPVAYLATQLQSTAKIALSVEDHENKYNEIGVIRDSNCTYEYYFLKAFSCSQDGAPFDVQLTLTTDDGIYIERAFSAYCDKLDVNCLNGGTFSDSKCHCDSRHTGNYCEKPVCRNGNEVENQCNCFAGYSGEFCENLMCTSWDFLSTHDTNNFEFQTVIFAIQNNQNAEKANQQIIDGIQGFIDTLLPDQQTQMKHYSLITFDDSQVENVINTVDTVEFVKKLIEKLQSPTKSSTKKVKAIQSMKLAAEISVYKPSIVYVFTNTETAIGNMIDTMEILSTGGAQINLIFTEAIRTSGATDYYKQAIIGSSGRYLWVPVEDIKSLLTNYLPSTVFENALILDEIETDCTKGVEYSFPIESRIKWFTIVARGTDVNTNIKITNSDGKELNPKIQLSDAGSYIATLDKTDAGGTKKITVKTSKGECGIQIRASSELHSEIGFTVDIHSDFPNERPTIVSANNGSNLISVRIGKSLISTIDVLPTQVQILSRNIRTGEDIVLDGGDLISRDRKRCANQYISSMLVIPTGPFKVNETPLFVKITGKEGDSDNFQRLQSYFPVPIKCKNGAKVNQFGYCECPSIYTGDDCAIPRCKNDGIVDLTVCACKSGFHGDICEKAVA